MGCRLPHCPNSNASFILSVQHSNNSHGLLNSDKGEARNEEPPQPAHRFWTFESEIHFRFPQSSDRGLSLRQALLLHFPLHSPTNPPAACFPTVFFSSPCRLFCLSVSLCVLSRLTLSPGLRLLFLEYRPSSYSASWLVLPSASWSDVTRNESHGTIVTAFRRALNTTCARLSTANR